MEQEPFASLLDPVEHLAFVIESCEGRNGPTAGVVFGRGHLDASVGFVQSGRFFLGSSRFGVGLNPCGSIRLFRNGR
jgi:hypothetical protein